MGDNQPLSTENRAMAKSIIVAFYYALFLTPAAAVIELDWRYVLWLLPCALLATAVRWLWRAPGVVAKTIAFVVNAGAAFANALLMISLRFQGVGFNMQFFHHMNWETVVIAAHVLAPLLIGCSAWWLLTTAWPWLLPRSADSPRTGAALGLAVLGVAFNAPALSLGWYVIADYLAAQRTIFVPKPKGIAANAGIRAAHRQEASLVLIYAEALEGTFDNMEVFGEQLTPRLSALAAGGLRFTNMRQVSYTGWTTGGLVASQCAMPTGAAGHRDSMMERLSFDADIPPAICLGDVLSAFGYHTVYMGGARLAFADKDGFLAAHGYRERHGLTTLQPRLPDPTYVSPWGLHDDSLFALAHQRLAELYAEDAPFLLTLLTLDTHSPIGYPSASCREGGEGGEEREEGGEGEGSEESEGSEEADPLAAVRCADQLIAAFIETVRENYPNVFVALFSDHLVPFDNALARRLAQFKDERRLRFAVWGPDVSAGAVDAPGTHFDVAPTLLDLLGFEAWAEHNMGASLARFDSPWFQHEEPYSLRVVYEPPALRISAGDPLTFDPRGPLIVAHETRVLATNIGLRLDAAAFAIALRADGSAEAIGRFGQDDAYDALSSWANGRAVIGVSTHQAFNRHLLATDAAMAFFAGVPNTASFAAGPLAAGAVTIAMPPFDASAGGVAGTL